MILYFVRHGETDWNKEGRLQGGRDTPLNPFGRVQAEEVGRRLSELVPDLGAVDFVSSPMERTRHTMEILRGELGLTPDEFRRDERLTELRFGRWEGYTWREIRKTDPAAARAREADKWGFVPPDGESYAALATRLRPFLASLSRDAIVVSHGGVARAMLNLFAGVSEDEAPRVAIWQGRVLMIEEGQYRWA